MQIDVIPGHYMAALASDTMDAIPELLARQTNSSLASGGIDDADVIPFEYVPTKASVFNFGWIFCVARHHPRQVPSFLFTNFVACAALPRSILNYSGVLHCIGVAGCACVSMRRDIGRSSRREINDMFPHANRLCMVWIAARATGTAYRGLNLMMHMEILRNRAVRQLMAYAMHREDGIAKAS